MEKGEDRQAFLENKPKLVALLQEANEEQQKNYNEIALLIEKLRGEAISQIV